MWLKLLLALGLGAGATLGAEKISQNLVARCVASGFEISSGLMDIVGYVFLIGFILGWKEGGRKLAIIWPLSIVLEVVAASIWKGI